MISPSASLVGSANSGGLCGLDHGRAVGPERRPQRILELAGLVHST
jgi:hypothetical protein